MKTFFIAAKTQEDAEENVGDYQLHSTFTEAAKQIEVDILTGCDVFRVEVIAVCSYTTNRN